MYDEIFTQIRNKLREAQENQKKDLSLLVCFFGEMLGTGLLVFLGCMGCIESEKFPNSSLQKAVVYGLVVMFLVQVFGYISGAFLNPAVVVAALIFKKINILQGIAFIVAEFVGAYIGYGLLKAMLPYNLIQNSYSEHHLCVTIPHPDITIAQALLIEFVCTSVHIFVCCSIWDSKDSTLLAIDSILFGFTVCFLTCIGGPFTGASTNPARSFAPAIWSHNLSQHWIYWCGPLLGSLATTMLYIFLFKSKTVEINKPDV